MIYQVLKDIQHIAKLLYLTYYLLNTNLKLSLISLALIVGKKIIEYYSEKASGSLDVDKFQKLVTIINEVWYEQSRIIRQFSKNG